MQQQAGITWRFAQPALTNGCAAARVRCFDDPSVHTAWEASTTAGYPHPGQRADAHDLLTVTRRIERLQQDLRHNSNGEKVRLESELTLFQRLQKALEGSIPLRDSAVYI